MTFLFLGFILYQFYFSDLVRIRIRIFKYRISDPDPYEIDVDPPYCGNYIYRFVDLNRRFWIECPKFGHPLQSSGVKPSLKNKLAKIVNEPLVLNPELREGCPNLGHTTLLGPCVFLSEFLSSFEELAVYRPFLVPTSRFVVFAKSSVLP